MRLYNYINENTTEETIDILKKDCKPFLNIIKRCKYPILRGTRRYIGSIEKIKPRKDRIPTNTPKLKSDFYDGGFNEVFGWKPRIEGVFAEPYMSFRSSTTSYGPLYLFFPIGNFKFIYSNTIYDLYVKSWNLPFELIDKKWEINDISDFYSKELDNDVEEVRDNFFRKYYTDKNLCDAYPGHEIMFKCNNYYLVSQKFKKDIIENFYPSSKIKIHTE